MRLIYLAMSLDVICALFVGLMIVAAFIDALIQPNLARLIAFMFVIAMVAFIASLAAFCARFSSLSGAPAPGASAHSAAHLYSPPQGACYFNSGNVK